MKRAWPAALLLAPVAWLLFPRVLPAWPLLACPALLLGACLWWVAQRQTSPGGALAALALYGSTPLAWRHVLAALAALGLFAMLYTGVGVAHALAGPRRKWTPRIVLMFLLSGFTGWASPLACGIGLVCVLAAGLYLVEGRLLRLLLPLCVLWLAAAAVGAWSTLGFASQWGDFPWLALVGPFTAFAAAMVLWSMRRSVRFFGHTAPLVAAAALLGLVPLAGNQALVWALAPVLVFVAGVYVDGFRSRAGRVWVCVAVVLPVLQVALIFLHGR